MAFIEEAGYEEFLARKRREAQERANAPTPDTSWWDQSRQPSPMPTRPPQFRVPPSSNDPLDRQMVLDALAKIRANAVPPSPSAPPPPPEPEPEPRPMPMPADVYGGLRDAAAANWQWNRPEPATEPEDQRLTFVNDWAQRAGEWNRAARENVPGVAGIEDVAGTTLGAVGAMSQQLSQPQAEMLWGPMVRGEVPQGLSDRGLPSVAESALSGIGNFARDVGETADIRQALSRAGQRWRGTEAPESLKMAAELSTPSELALAVVPVPIEKAGQAAKAGAKALRQVVSNPEIQRNLARLERVVPRLGIEDITRNPALAPWQAQIEKEAEQLIANARPYGHITTLSPEHIETRQRELYPLLTNPRVSAERRAEVLHELATLQASLAHDKETIQYVIKPRTFPPAAQDVTPGSWTGEHFSEEAYRRQAGEFAKPPVREEGAPYATGPNEQAGMFSNAEPGMRPQIPSTARPGEVETTADLLGAPQFENEAAKAAWEREQAIRAGQGELFGESAAALPAPQLDNALAKIEKQVPGTTLGDVRAAVQNNVDAFPVSEVSLDPARFQYKVVQGEGGATGSLSGVERWDPDLAQGAQLWRDPASGKVFAVNAHNRTMLARRLGIDSLPNPYFIPADTAEQARAIGAMANIASGRGNAVDAAKFFRDSSLTTDDLRALGLSFREKLVTDGAALANLNDGLFNVVARGEFPIERAVAIGQRLTDPDLQNKLVSMLDKEARRGRRITNDVVAELADMVATSPAERTTQMGLFGENVFTNSLAVERAEVLAGIKSQLIQDKRLFGIVARNAPELGRAGNIIEVAGSRAISTEAAQLLELFDRVKNQVGEVSDIVNSAARQLAGGENAAKVKEATYERIRETLPRAVRGGQASSGEGVQALPSSGSAPQAAPAQAASEVGQPATEGRSLPLAEATPPEPPATVPTAPSAASPTAPAPVSSPREIRPQPAPRPERVLPEPVRPPSRPPQYNALDETPVQREQAPLEGFEGTSTVPPREGQPRLPGEAGRVPPETPRTPSDPMNAPEPPPPDGLLPRFPSNVTLEARVEQGGWPRGVERLIAKVPGGKRVVGAADPWAIAQTHVERIPMVFRQLEAMGGDIVRTGMAHLEAIPLKGVKIVDGRFVEGVKPLQPGLSMATSDVLEHIGSYEVAPALRDFVRAANSVNDDLVRWAKAEGVKINQMKFGEGGHYFGRLVREIRDIEKEGRLRPDLPRHYDSMEAGMDAGVTYSDDLLATAQAGYSWLIRKIISKRMGEYAAELGRTPKQLIDSAITSRAVDSVNTLRIVRNYERTVRAMRDGMAPTFQTRTPAGGPGERVRAQLTAIDAVEPGVSQQVLETYNRVKDLPVGDPIRQGAFKQLLDDAKELGKQTLAEYKTATAERAKALRGLQSPEYAEGERFGMPKGTIGVGPVYQTWAAGRAFPREVADYLNRTFGETSHKILKAFDTVSTTSRTLVAGFDFGTTQIQLQGVMFSRPKVWAKAFGNMFAAVANPETYHAYMGRPATQAVLKRLIPHGLTIEGAEYAEAFERGGALERLAGKMGPKVGGFVQEQVLKRAEMAFTAPLNVGKIELAKALLPIAERDGVLNELAMFLNNMTGTRSSLAAGIGPGQRSVESAFIFFSPRFTRSSLAIVSDSMQGGLKGSEARKALASLLVGGAFITGGLRLALGQPINNQFFDPSSGEFLTVELFGRRVGLGGPYRALAVLVGNSYKAAIQDPAKFLDLKDRRENPLVRWWTSRAAPVTGLLWDAIEGKDFLGEPLDNPGAVARRGAKMVVPMAAAEFVPEPGGKTPEPASIIPDMLGLRAIPLSPAMERDRLRDQYARAAYGQDWTALDQAKQAALQAKHPDLVEAAQSAIDTYSRRGSVLHEFRQDVAKAREEPQQQIAALTDQLHRGQISGQDYRKAVQEREADIAQVPTILQRTAKYGDIPVKQEEWQAWAERHGQPMPERQAPVDIFLNDYYGLADKFRDTNTGEVNPAQLVKAREDLKRQYPVDVVKEALGYVNRNRDPEYVQAQAEFSAYMALPKYAGLTAEQGQIADKVASAVSYIKSTSKRTGQYVNPVPVVQKLYGPDALKLYAIASKQPKGTFERFKFRKEHPLIDKFYGRSPSGVAPQDLMPAVGQ